MVASPAIAPSLLVAGRFRLEQALGKGPRGIVHRAYDEATSTRVALKRLLPAGERPGTLCRDALSQAQELQHAHVGRLLEFGPSQGPLRFLASELVTGEPFDRWLEVGRGDRRLLGGVIRQVLDALDHAHGRGVLHRNLGPHNVLVVSGPHEPGTTAYVVDFDLAGRVRHPDSWAPEPLGCDPTYAAPEVVGGDAASVQSDLYSVGALFLEALGDAGEAPHGPYAHRLRRAAFDDIVTRVRTAISVRLADLLAALLAEDPADRPDSALVAQLELEACLAERRTIGAALVATRIRASGTPPWTGEPPFPRFETGGSPQQLPRPCPAAEEQTLSALWSRYGMVMGDEPSTPSFYVRTGEGLILGPFGWPNLIRILEKERQLSLSPEVWVTTDRTRWTSMEAFAAWTEQPHLSPGLPAAELEPTSLDGLIARAGALTSNRSTGRLTVTLRGERGPRTWRADVAEGQVIRFEFADPASSLPCQVAELSGDESARFADDAARALVERKSLWEVWQDRGWRHGAPLRNQLLHRWAEAPLALNVEALAWSPGRPCWTGSIGVPSLLGLLMYEASRQPKGRFTSSLAPFLDRAWSPPRDLTSQLDRLAPDEAALHALRTLLAAPSTADALAAGAEPGIVYVAIASRWVRAET